MHVLPLYLGVFVTIVSLKHVISLFRPTVVDRHRGPSLDPGLHRRIRSQTHILNRYLGNLSILSHRPRLRPTRRSRSDSRALPSPRALHSYGCNRRTPRCGGCHIFGYVKSALSAISGSPRVRPRYYSEVNSKSSDDYPRGTSFPSLTGVLPRSLILFSATPGQSDRGSRYGVWMFTSMTFATSRTRSGAVLTNSSSGIRLVGVERLIAP